MLLNRLVQIVGRAGVGVDNINREAATRKGVIVMNTPGGNTRAAAELTVSLMASMMRQVPMAHMSMAAGKWERKAFMGTEMNGKVLGIIGIGSIGGLVAKYAQAFGMTVVAFDPALTPEGAADLGVTSMPSPIAVMAEADVISLHVPGEGNTNMLSTEQFACMKDGVFVVNAARGNVIDMSALHAALESGKVAGAALDVFPEEPVTSEAAMAVVNHPNVVCTPHLGASTEEAQVQVAKEIAEQMCDALEGSRFEGVVNAPFVGLTRDATALPFLECAEAIGSMLAQLAGSTAGFTRVEIVYRGRTMEADKRYVDGLKGAVMKGALPHMRPDLSPAEVNLINSPFLAAESGVELVVMGSAEAEAMGVDMSAGEEYVNNLLVRAVDSSGRMHQLSGSVIDGKPRIVGVDEWRNMHTFRPVHTVLVLNNIDRPGAVAGVTAVLAEAGINVAAMGVARQGVGMPALCLLTVDDRVPKAVRTRIESLDQISAVRTATFDEYRTV